MSSGLRGLPNAAGAVREKRDAGPGVDALFADLLKAGESLPRIREVLAQRDPDDVALIALLRRAVPLRLLEHLGSVPPWSERRRVLGAVVLNPKTPRTLGLRLVGALYWHDLAEVAASPRLASGLRVRAEGLLGERLPDLRLGDRISLARLATPPVLVALLGDAEPMVARSALLNPRLREADLLVAVRRDTATRALLEETAASPRWREAYAVRLALALQTRTPLSVALGQLSALSVRDLLRVARTPELKPLLQAAAERLAATREAGRPGF